MTVSKKRIHVAVGVIQNQKQEVLIAKRAMDVHQGGLWEFPGGKVEAGESVETALHRELKEELGISVTQLSPLINIHHDYPDLSVLLEVWKIESFEGEPTGLQSQPLQWVSVEQLHDFAFPVANQPIITALRLSREMMITGEWKDREEFNQRLKAALEKGVRLVQLRAHQSSPRDYLQLFQQAKNLCDEYKALLIANTSLDIFHQLPAAAGIHVTSHRLSSLNERPVDKSILCGASCHNQEEIEQAHRMGADYLVLGPVYKTATHPEAIPLGMTNFSRLASRTSLPVFALGGLQIADKTTLLQAGAYGISGINLYWQ